MSKRQGAPSTPTALHHDLHPFKARRVRKNEYAVALEDNYRVLQHRNRVSVASSEPFLDRVQRPK